MAHINKCDARELTLQRLKTLLKYHADGEFTWLVTTCNSTAGERAGSYNTGDGYIQIGIDGTVYKAHVLAWFYMYGIWPVNAIDHKDRNRTNNSIANLRDVTQSLNLFNAAKRIDNTSGTKGVFWHKQAKKWYAKAGNSCLYYGSSKELAIAARAAWEIAHCQLHNLVRILP